MFCYAEHYFAKAIILATGPWLVNKVNPHGFDRVFRGCRQRDRQLAQGLEENRAT